jgi:anaerobic dimethyl sulfoxide reductase subunit B (iron-sulfur subunit)
VSEQWGFYFDPERCMGCHACAIACKNRHGVDEDGVDWRRVEHVESGSFPDVSETNVSLSCMHCADPPCEKVCPAGAIEKRESDGIVTVDQDACIGCHYCGWACPYGAPQYGSDGKMQKCNLCLEKGPGSGVDAPAKQDQEAPLAPACANECVGDALVAGPMGDLMDLASQRAAEAFRANDDAVNIIIEPGADRPVRVEVTEEGSAD